MLKGLLNPYSEPEGRWIRGNFHSHTQESGSGCAFVPLVDGVRMYHDLGVGFHAVTDHDKVTDLDEMRVAYPDMIFLSGFEYSREENMIFAGQQVPPLHQLSLHEAMGQSDDLLTIVCHPKPKIDQDYWTLDKLLSLPRLPDAVEVYNGHYGIDKMIDWGHRPQFTDFWDYLLTSNLCLWGVANDDFHEPDDFNNAWNMVLAEEPTVEAIIRAVKSGRCYGTTGLLLDHVEISGDKIHVAVQSHCTGRFIGPAGVILSETQGRSFDLLTPDDFTYIRFEGQSDSAKLFLQPFFRSSTSVKP